MRALTGRATLLLLVAIVLACTPPPSDSAARRQEVVDLVMAGDLGTPSGTVDESIELPDAYRDVSDGGSIFLRRIAGVTTIVFFLPGGILDDWTGFVFRSEGVVDDDPLQGGGPVKVQDLGGGWFRVQTE